jgi:hypothetical protein
MNPKSLARCQMIPVVGLIDTWLANGLGFGNKIGEEQRLKLRFWWNSYFMRR